jgi:S-formylglutathione hydrolase FrmB
LVPALLKKYNDINRKEIFITGLSMGGHGAMSIYMSNESFFRDAGSISGILDIREFPAQWGISKVLGQYVKENYPYWDNNSAIENLNKLKQKSRSLIIDCGTEDFAYNVNVEFKEKAEKLGIKVIFNSRKGIHNWTFWKDALVNHLNYFKSLCKN